MYSLSLSLVKKKQFYLSQKLLNEKDIAISKTKNGFFVTRKLIDKKKFINFFIKNILTILIKNQTF